MALSGFAMEELFKFLDIVPTVAEGQSVFEKNFFQVDFTFVMNMIVFGITGFLYYARNRGLRAEGDRRDPICGMASSENDWSAEYDGETYYFCSTGCRDTFLEDPEAYLETSNA
jgi:YHS domain-containing protein